MSVSSYAFINAKIRGKKSRFLSAGDYERLYKAPSIEELARILSSSSIANEDLNHVLLSSDGLNSRKVDRLLSQQFIQETRQLSRVLPNYAQRFITAFFERIYFDALKLIIKSKDAGLTREQSLDLLIIPDYKDTVAMERMLDLPGIPQIIEAIPEPWIKISLQEALSDYDQTKSTLPLEQSLNKELFERIWQKSRSISFSDQKGVKALLGSEIDFINLSVILRCKLLEIDQETTKRWIIPINYRLSQEMIDTLIQVNAQEFLSRLATSSYKDLADQARDLFKDPNKIQVYNFELMLKQFLAHKANTVLTGFPFQLGIYFAWYTLSLRQIENVRSILVGKIAGLSTDVIRREIVFF